MNDHEVLTEAARLLRGSEHIAGLNPAVAVSLAELFEEYATRFPDRTPDQHGDVAKKLIAVARMYLRESVDEQTS